MVPDEVNVYLWRDGLPPVLPDARQGSLAHRRHPAGGIARPRRPQRSTTCSRRCAREAGAGLAFKACTWFSTYRIHHRRAARFRDRRCFLLGDAAHIHSPVGRAGHEHRPAGRLQPGLEARARRRRAARTRRCSTPTRRSASRSRSACSTRPTAHSRLVVSDSWFAGLLAHAGSLARIAAFAMTLERDRSASRSAPSRRSASAIRRARFRSRCRIAGGAPPAGDRFPWLRLKLRPDGPIEDLFRPLDDTRFNLLVFGDAPAQPAGGFGDLLRIHAIPAIPDNERSWRAPNSAAVVLSAAPRRPCRPLRTGFRRRGHPSTQLSRASQFQSLRLGLPSGQSRPP